MFVIEWFCGVFFQVAWQTISDRCFLKWYISRWYIFCDSNASFKWQMVEGNFVVSQIPSQGPAGLEKSKSPKVSGLGCWIQIPGLLGNARYVSIWRKMEVAVMFWSIWIFTWIAFSISQQKKTQIYKKNICLNKLLPLHFPLCMYISWNAVLTKSNSGSAWAKLESKKNFQEVFLQNFMSPNSAPEMLNYQQRP